MAINWHKIAQLPLLSNNIELAQLGHFSSYFDIISCLNASFLNTNPIVKIINLYFLLFSFWFLPQFF